MDLATRLRDADLRATGPRLAILAAVEDGKNHPSAEELHASLKEAHPSLSVSTIYNTLEVFLRVGLCRRVSGKGPRLRVDGTLHEHDHAICTTCGRIYDVPRHHALGQSPSPELSGMKICRVRVEYDVICGECLETTHLDLDSHRSST